MKFPFVSRSAYDALELKTAELNQEYANYRRRNAEIQTTAHNAGIHAAVTQLLPVYDNLLRALSQPCEDEAYCSGIRMTMDILESNLTKLGIEKIPAEGQPFDPRLHEAMEHIDDPELGENTVAKVILTGFQKDGAIIRHALVVVAN